MQKRIGEIDISDTENSYLYRGEQFDSFTGLYYLRARYMNPATGTFITMDEYAGSVFEPVSLHKYLYANANPVMFSDPSGYSAEGTLSGQMTAISVIGVLSAIIIPNYSQFVNAIGFLMTEIYDAFAIAADTIAEWVEGLFNGSQNSSSINDDFIDEVIESSTSGTISSASSAVEFAKPHSTLKSKADEKIRDTVKRKRKRHKYWEIEISNIKVDGHSCRYPVIGRGITEAAAIARLAVGKSVITLFQYDAKRIAHFAGNGGRLLHHPYKNNPQIGQFGHYHPQNHSNPAHSMYIVGE